MGKTSFTLALIVLAFVLAPFVHAQPAPVVNTSLYAIKDTVADFNFSAGTGYQLVHQTVFNTTDANSTFVQHITLNINKLSIGTANQIYLRTKIDGATIVDERVRTTSVAGEVGSTGTYPEMFSVPAGSHNFTLEVMATGAGGLSVDDIDLTLLEMKATTNISVHGQITAGVFNHSSANFVPAFNYTIFKGLVSPTFNSVKQTITATFTGQSGVTASYQFKNLNDNDTSPYWTRFLQLTNDVGSMGMGWTDANENAVAYNQTILSRVTTVNPTANPVVRSNTTVFSMDLRDNQSNLINNFQVHNNQTNLTSFIDYSSPGIYNIVNKTVTIYNGTGYFLAMSVSFKSQTGTDTPTFFINASNVPQSVCYSKKERYMVSVNDVAVAFIFMICSNLTVGNNYTFNLWIEPPGPVKTIRLFEESFNGFEVNPLSSTDTPLPPIPTIITNPANGSCAKGILNITWLPFTDPEGNNITYNVSLYNPTGTFNQTINGSTSLTSQLFDTTTVPNGNWTVVVEGCDTLGLCANTSVNFTIDNIPPQVFSLKPVANSSFFFGDVIEIAANVTDNEKVGGVVANITYPDGSSTLLTLVNTTGNPGGGKYNASFTVPSINGRYNITFIANDTCAGNFNRTETTYFNTINITIAKTGQPDHVIKGSQLNYTITISNTGTGTAFNLVLIEYYPSGVAFNSSSPAPSVGNDTWYLGNLSAGASLTVNITVDVSANLSNGTILENIVNLTFSDSEDVNKTVSAEFSSAIAGSPAIVAEKTGSPSPVLPNAYLYYVINVSNIGDAIAYNITVIETESNELVFVNASPPPDSTSPDTWLIPQINDHQSVLINITKKVANLTNGTIVYNNATVTHDNKTINLSTSTPVSPVPLITVAKTSNPDPVTSNEQLNYTITVSNTGGAPALNVVVTETYPSGLTFDSASPSPSSGNNIWNLGTIQNGSSIAIKITLNVDPSLNGTILNLVNITYYNNVTDQNVTVRTNESTVVNPPPTPPPTSTPSGGGGGRYVTTTMGACVNGSYITEAGVRYGPICCPGSELYCKTLGENWDCRSVAGKTFKICKLSETAFVPQPVVNIPEETAEPAPAPLPSKSQKIGEEPKEPTAETVVISPELKKDRTVLALGIIAVLAVAAFFSYLVFIKKKF